MNPAERTPSVNKGLFTDQMGAMARVDELRHRQMELEEHLDIRQRKQEVANGIRSYYTSQGIAFDDKQIEDGVRQHFAQRLTFEPSKLNFFERVLAQRIVRRWATLLLLVQVLAVSYYIESRRYSEQDNHTLQTPSAAVAPATPSEVPAR